MSMGSLISRDLALVAARPILDCFEQTFVVGSLRRGKAEVRDVDVLVYGDPRDAKRVASALRCGAKRGSFLVEGVQVDVIAIPNETCFGAMLLHFTGSKEHNILMRESAMERGWKLNEYGLWDRSTGELLPFFSEQEIFQALDMEFVEPGSREVLDDGLVGA